MKSALTITSNAREFGANLDEYCRISSKGYEQALNNQAREFAVGPGGLYEQFRKIRPTATSILDAAKGRNFRVLRKQSTSLVPVSGGLSARAMKKAKALLGGQKSELFRYGSGGALLPVRFGTRGQRKGRILQGGRTGYRFAKSALRGYQLSGKQLSDALNEKYSNGGKRGDNVRRLNIRALAVYLELRYRSRATHGGTMAVQWLFKQWKKNLGKFGGKLESRSAAEGHKIIGTVEFEKDALGVVQSIAITGFTPGTEEQAAKHGIIDKAFVDRAKDLRTAIENAHKKAAKMKGFIP